jgi:hypothetical protein
VNCNFYRCLIVKEQSVRLREAIASFVVRELFRPTKGSCFLHHHLILARAARFFFLRRRLVQDSDSDSPVEILVEQENRLLLMGDLEGVQIADGDDAKETVLAIDNRQMANAAVLHGAACFL